MQVFSLINQFSQLAQHNAANQDISWVESISQRRVLLENSSPLIKHIELLENGVNTIIPLNFCFIYVTVCIIEISKLMQSLDQQELLLSLP